MTDSQEANVHQEEASFDGPLDGVLESLSKHTQLASPHYGCDLIWTRPRCFIQSNVVCGKIHSQVEPDQKCNVQKLEDRISNGVPGAGFEIQR